MLKTNSSFSLRIHTHCALVVALSEKSKYPSSFSMAIENMELMHECFTIHWRRKKQTKKRGVIMESKAGTKEKISLTAYTVIMKIQY